MTDKVIPLLLNLILHSKIHHDYPMWVVGRNFLPSLEVGNFRLYVQDGKAIGFVNWTFLTLDEVDLLIKSGGIMNKDLWREAAIPGSIFFVPELLAPPPAFNLIRADLEQLFIGYSIAYGLSWRNSSSPRVRKIRSRLNSQ